MRFLFDQSADFRLIEYLIPLGHDVRAISREYRGGLPDEEVLAISVGEQRILITADHDFGELVIRNALPHAGILLMRLPGASLETKIARLSDALTRFSDHGNPFVVVTERRVRVRRTA